MTDQRIIELHFSRSETAIYETNVKYGKNCRSLSYGTLKNYEDGTECVNSSYLNVWNSIPPKRPQSFKDFLMKIVRNIALNMFERNRAQKRGGGEIEVVLDELSEVLPSKENVEKTVEDKELVLLINGFLSSLTAEKRKILVMRYFYIKTIKEIAENLGISEGKTKMILKRLKDELKELLLKEGVEL